MTLAVLPVFLWINASRAASGTLSLASRSSSSRASPEPLRRRLVHPPGCRFAPIIFLVSLFAETNRLPFDMAEGEADLVGGFHTEYGSLKWGLFFVAEYSPTC